MPEPIPEEEFVNARIAVALSAVALLLVGGVTWWTVRDGDDPGAEPAAPTTTSEPHASSEPPTPSASPSPTLAGEPVSDCAPEESAGRIVKTFWGMHLNDPIGEGYPDAPISTVNLTTAQVYWNQVETAPGQYDFSRLDDIVATARDRGAQPMMVLGFTPSFHAQQPGSETARATMPDLAAWRAWVTAVVDRYGAGLDYQIWPEPNIISNWSGTAAQMARLSAIAGKIIHARAPKALVVAPATTLRLKSQRGWMDRFWATEVDGAPVSETVDAVALDPFPLEEGTPEDSLDLICQAQQILDDHGVDLPVWTNEINYGVPSGGGATDVQHYQDDRQSAAVVRTYLLHAALGVERVYWLGWFSSPGMAVELEREGATTPAGEAFATVRGWLAGGPRPTCRIDGGVHTCLVDDRKQETRILWRVRGTSTVRTEAGARVESLAGERRVVRPDARIRVGQSPVAVISTPD